ncbi:hypothetical protein HDU76_005921 [Blyttiomyces sp. JEL0837]|nr:hypothetical protein HDU76_005921 [Blyttiomyces sp. JEL0837]
MATHTYAPKSAATAVYKAPAPPKTNVNPGTPNVLTMVAPPPMATPSYNNIEKNSAGSRSPRKRAPRVSAQFGDTFYGNTGTGSAGTTSNNNYNYNNGSSYGPQTSTTASCTVFKKPSSDADDDLVAGFRNVLAAQESSQEAKQAQSAAKATAPAVWAPSYTANSTSSHNPTGTFSNTSSSYETNSYNGYNHHTADTTPKPVPVTNRSAPSTNYANHVSNNNVNQHITRPVPANAFNTSSSSYASNSYNSYNNHHTADSAPTVPATNSSAPTSNYTNPTSNNYMNQNHIKPPVPQPPVRTFPTASTPHEITSFSSTTKSTNTTRSRRPIGSDIYGFTTPDNTKSYITSGAVPNFSTKPRQPTIYPSYQSYQPQPQSQQHHITSTSNAEYYGNNPYSYSIVNGSGHSYTESESISSSYNVTMQSDGRVAPVSGNSMSIKKFGTFFMNFIAGEPVGVGMYSQGR